MFKTNDLLEPGLCQFSFIYALLDGACYTCMCSSWPLWRHDGACYTCLCSSWLLWGHDGACYTCLQQLTTVETWWCMLCVECTWYMCVWCIQCTPLAVHACRLAPALLMVTARAAAGLWSCCWLQGQMPCCPRWDMGLEKGHGPIAGQVCCRHLVLGALLIRGPADISRQPSL